MMKLSHYEILGLDSDCSLEDVKRAYREKLLNSHPDKKMLNESKQYCGNISVNAIQKAYQVLADTKSRSEYDNELMESHKKQGYHSFGDGLDEYSLDEFYFNTDIVQYCMDCPRCKAEDGFHFSEDTLEEHAQERNKGGFEVLSQCSACSLWLKVNFDLAEEYEEAT